MRSNGRRRARRWAAFTAGLVGVGGLTASLTAPAVGADAGPTPSNFQKLRSCESGDNYSTDTGNGYYGAYQFDVQTWQGLGYQGRPDQAQPATQDQAARQLYDQRGWSPWPSCSRQEGLD
ncbi:MAG TPA: transglycosylase family protein [Acidimicrobiales bacterium]|nr:transglycosylase family protein [Acidimicrobiales bacterium]